VITTAIILAGGMGTRLKPLTDKIPKPLVPIQDRPLLEHIILHFKKYGVKKVILSVGYKAEQIKAYFKDGKKLGVKIEYAEECLPLGTGGALKKAASGIREPVFVQWGDNLIDMDWSEMEKIYHQQKNPVIMSLVEREDVENFGVAKLKGDKIIGFVEKPKRENAPSKWISAGAFVIDTHVFDDIPEESFSMERNYFEKIAPFGKISAYFHHGQWFPTDTMEKYLLAKEKYVVKYN
jgi:mannose-1-phosphate guanylyltransferase